MSEELLRSVFDMDAESSDILQLKHGQEEENGADGNDSQDILAADLPVTDSDSHQKLVRLPMSRIKRIMKMDPDVNLASQEAVFLITKATELLLDSLSKEAYSYTVSENKKTVTRKHLETAINNIDALAFLDGALDWT